MRAAIDTNIFVYATYSSFPQFRIARDFLKLCVEGTDLWYVSWGVVYEYLRVVTHRQIFPEETLSFDLALANVLQFSSSPHVEFIAETADHPKALENLKKENSSLAGNILHDAHLVVLMREHDLSTIYTADTDFHRFKNISVTNPLNP